MSDEKKSWSDKHGATVIALVMAVGFMVVLVLNMN
jgi:hypothetical protein